MLLPHAGHARSVLLAVLQAVQLTRNTASYGRTVTSPTALSATRHEDGFSRTPIAIRIVARIDAIRGQDPDPTRGRAGIARLVLAVAVVAGGCADASC